VSESTAYLSADEVAAAGTLHRDAPYALCNVSRGFFSIARHYGGCTFQGSHYTYMPGFDECVRDDVLRLVTKLRNAAGKKSAKPASVQLELSAAAQKGE
jgi:hypothetical protein